MSKPTIEQKYQFLLKHLYVIDVDLWENDALLVMNDKLYLQFGGSEGDVLLGQDVDRAVELAMAADAFNEASTARAHTSPDDPQSGG